MTAGVAGRVAWLAGLWDGEGSIGVNDDGRGRMRPRLQMSMASKPTIDTVIDVLAEIGVTGAGYTYQERDPEKHQDAHYLRVGRREDVRKVADALLPHAVTKAEHWRTMLAWLDDPAQKHVDELKRLNLRGAAKVVSDKVLAQPVSGVQWIDRNDLTANSYNPNHAAPTELELLKLSIISDGWTQPIVVRRDHEIVDGFHRWTASADPRVGGLTGGLVPIVYLRDDLTPEAQRLATVRHNRARGTHHVLKMADLVAQLVDGGVSEEALETLLGMEVEEVERLVERGKMSKRGASARLGRAWRPVPQEEADEVMPEDED